MYNTGQMVQPTHFGRRTGKNSTVLFLFVSLLILGIFSWGLEYKLSLYQVAQTPQITVPAAKLLSQKERPLSQNALSAVFDHARHRTFATSTMLGMLCVVIFCRALLRNQKIVFVQSCSSGRLLRGYMRYFFSRPPPLLYA